MDTQKMQALFGLKWNPFSPEVPVEALSRTPKIQSFCQRVESLVIDGGFGMISGEPGLGKSVLLRILADDLAKIRDLRVAVISRPQSGMTDFYREIAVLFGFAPNVSNRWGSYKALREKWLSHIETTLCRPVVLIDEAQETPAAVLSELRLLSSAVFDSRSILTVILCGDNRLPERFRTPELAPLGSRIRTRFRAEAANRDEMIDMMHARLDAAGNPTIMTEELVETLVDHASGNCRVLLQSADELLVEGLAREVKSLDAKLFFEVYKPQEPRSRKPAAPAARRA
jgi:type II secretory pathway predicted ATPase ExeA